jgi:gas vesicle protein
MNNQQNGSSFLSGLVFGSIAGAIAGATLGVLFAPQSGAETRKQLRLKAEEYEEKSKQAYLHAKETVQKDVDKIVEEMRPAVAKARNLSAREKEELRVKTIEMLLEEDESVVAVEKVDAKIEEETKKEPTKRGRPAKSTSSK